MLISITILIIDSLVIYHPSKIGMGNGMSIVTPKKYSQFWDFSTLG